MQKVPLTKNLIGILLVSPAELSFDQKMSLTSITAHRGIHLVGLDAGSLRDIFIEMSCNPRTAVDNPLLNNAGHARRRSFIVIDEGELGAEGFLDAHGNIFYIYDVYDERHEAWFQRRFQGRRSGRGKGKKRGGKGRSRGRGGRNFCKSRRKKKGHYHEDHGQEDWSWQTEEPWRWQANQPDDGWAAESWKSWDQESAHEHVESYKSKSKDKKSKKGKDGNDKKGSCSVASSQSEAQTAAEVPSLPALFCAMRHAGGSPHNKEPEGVANITLGRWKLIGILEFLFDQERFL